MVCIQNDVVCLNYFAYVIEMGYSHFFLDDLKL